MEAAANALLTQAVKKYLDDGGKKYSSNVLALVDALIVGIGGTAILYIVCDMPFDLKNIIFIVCMALAVWVSSMVSYDKVVGIIRQIAAIGEVKG